MRRVYVLDRRRLADTMRTELRCRLLTRRGPMPSRCGRRDRRRLSDDGGVSRARAGRRAAHVRMKRCWREPRRSATSQTPASGPVMRRAKLILTVEDHLWKSVARFRLIRSRRS